MSLQLAAQHLASKGRGPDDMLVHMSRGEVKSLSDLATAHGGQLTINPHTGLPEAGFLSMILPMVAGAALGPAGMGLTAMQAGLAVGAGSYLLNPKGGLMGALSSGLGGYGGAGLGAGLEKLATSEAGLTSGQTANAAIDEQMQQMQAARDKVIQEKLAAGYNPASWNVGNFEEFNAGQQDWNKALPQPYTPAENAMNRVNLENEYQNTRGYVQEPNGKYTPLGAPESKIPSGFEAVKQGISSVMSDPSKLKDVGGGSWTGLAQMGLAAAAPAASEKLGRVSGLNVPTTQQKAQVVPHYRFNPGMVTPTPAAGAAGVENTYFNPSYTALSDEEAAKLYPGYPAAKAANGGIVGYAGGGTPYEPISGGSGVTAQTAAPSTGSPTGSTIGDIGYAVSNQSISPVAAALAQAAMDALSPTSVNSVNAVNGMDAQSDAASAAAAAAAAADASGGAPGMGGGAGPSSDSSASSDGGGGASGEARGGLAPLFKHHMAAGGVPRYGFGGFLGDSLSRIGSAIGHIGKSDSGGDPNGWAHLEEMMGMQRPKQDSGQTTAANVVYDPNTQQYQQMAMGGLSDARYNLGGYSDGGRLLRGPGDGVSDSIPAVIGKKQPARLADGEFVVPARIVSELGNGSTEAGARKLYAMMDRIQASRKNTVGKGKVAKNNRADKYLPA